MLASRILRVRQLLDTGLAPFKKLLPKDVLAVPALETQRYPSALLSSLKVVVGAECYSYLGIIAEDLLRIPPGGISVGSVVSTTKKHVPAMDAGLLEKIRVSKTTPPFCTALNTTTLALRASLIPGAGLRFEQVVSKGQVQGHPDMRNATQVFEVKLTGRLPQGWTYFLCQVFAYAALEPAFKEVHLVLPLQQTVWKRSLADWDKRDAYLEQLQKTAERLSAPVGPPPALAGADLSGIFMGLLAGGGGGFLDLSGAGLGVLLGGLPAAEDVGAKIRRECEIGSHIQKLPTLKATFESAPNPVAPWQIFLGSTQSSKLNIKDADIAAGAAVLAATKTRFFVHSPYIINLCHPPTEGDNWHQELLKKNLRYASSAGCKGVVVHVGKAVGRPLPEALANMRANVLACLEAATPACPLLLETPAGQGTEVLTDADEFIAFVASFKDERFRICLDTCHTFVCGQEPLSYIKKVQATDPTLLTLIHYNDSAVPCGCRKDRHAFMGTGHIGMEKMEAIARHCHASGLPMVIE